MVTTQNTYADVFNALRQHAPALAQTTAAERIAKLKRLHNLLMSRRTDLQKAVYQDMQKPAEECDLTELFPVLASIRFATPRLAGWLKPQSVATPLPMLGTTSHILYEPKGTALIISPWNYPFNLSFDPLVSAVAAGNSVLLKPSELTPHCAELMQSIVNELFAPNEVQLIQGDAAVATELLKLPFNHIFFTGSPHIGKIVMRAAAENLSSITLELGGKSPAIVDETAQINDAAQKIAWGKYSNNGQTCIAPDYVLVHHSQEQALVDALKKHIAHFYGSNDAEQISSKSYGRVVNQHHFNRLLLLLQNAVNGGATISTGGTYNEDENFISPTVLQNLAPNDELLQQEIFGPILPIIAYKTIDEALSIINAQNKPLSLYIFTEKTQNADFIIENTSAGGTCVNNTLIHFFNHNLPFGGVNNSGIGKTHGFFGFEAFSNARGIVRQKIPLAATQLMYPPYSKREKTIIDLSIKYL